MIGALIFMLPVSLYISIICFDYVIDSWRLLEGSREPGGLPFVYILKSFLLLFSISFVLQALAEIICHSFALRDSYNKFYNTHHNKHRNKDSAVPKEEGN